MLPRLIGCLSSLNGFSVISRLWRKSGGWPPYTRRAAMLRPVGVRNGPGILLYEANTSARFFGPRTDQTSP